MRLGLRKAAGPECPQCGSTATEPYACTWRGLYIAVDFGCDDCRHEFTIQGRAKGKRQAPPCPYCGSHDNVATSTPGRVQRRKCRACGENFDNAK